MEYAHMIAGYRIVAGTWGSHTPISTVQGIVFNVNPRMRWLINKVTDPVDSMFAKVDFGGKNAYYNEGSCVKCGSLSVGADTYWGFFPADSYSRVDYELTIVIKGNTYNVKHGMLF
ncbi:hypothetical protein ABJI51_25690 [Amycolatopsis sp. NEAU-NG30]|uniref:Uncharacterized protein n=1 Tax=Amycolatopsis melonis TaxID=3156488 RepID=A0ABV0LJL3_9PSEU